VTSSIKVELVQETRCACWLSWYNHLKKIQSSWISSLQETRSM